MLIHGVDRGNEDEWRAFVAAHPFGDLVAGGRNRDVPIVVPTQFVLDGEQITLHLARPNPIWAAIEENPTGGAERGGRLGVHPVGMEGDR